METGIKIMIGFGVTAFLFVTALFADANFNRELDKKLDAVLIDKTYVPPVNATGYGVASNGEMTTTQISSSEKYTVVVKIGEKFERIKSDETAYYAHNIGDTVKISLYKSRIFSIPTLTLE